jgi:uncharacterized integral membrane protein
MKRLFLILVTFLVALLGLTFAVHNPQQVEVHYYFDWIWRGSLALLLFLTLTVGLLIGWLAGRLRGFIQKKQGNRRSRMGVDSRDASLTPRNVPRQFNDVNE